MSEHIHRRHNKSLLLYHLVCPIKYRRDVLTSPVEKSLVFVCEEISERYEIHFVEIGSEEDHVHFMVQSFPMLSTKTIVQTIKSITAKELFRLHPEVKQKLWRGQFWSNGYYMNTVGQYAKEETIRRYIEQQEIHPMAQKSITVVLANSDPVIPKPFSPAFGKYLVTGIKISIFHFVSIVFCSLIRNMKSAILCVSLIENVGLK